MLTQSKPITILIADDDPDDRMLTRDAFEESRLRNVLEMVEDGEELMDYRGQTSSELDPSRPEYATQGWS
jgi:two-component system response regulator